MDRKRDMSGTSAKKLGAGRLGRFAVAGLLLGLAMAAPAYADGTATPAFTITDPRITESSGLATDPVNKVYWTINDSGDDGILYALDEAGKTVGTQEFDVDPRDAEALAYHEENLFVGDIGDNGRRRETIMVYQISDPTPDGQGFLAASFELSYPDGAHDAEAMMISEDGQIFIVTKEVSGGAIYAAPRQLRTSRVNQLRRVADAPPMVTDGTTLADGRFAVRTYISIEVLQPELFGIEARAALPIQPQGETLTTSLAGDTLLVGSEGVDSVVVEVPVPTQLVAVTAAASPVPATPGAAAADGEPEDGATTDRSGTLWALAAALLVSLGAAAVVFFRGRPTGGGATVAKRAIERPRPSWTLPRLPVRRPREASPEGSREPRSPDTPPRSPKTPPRPAVRQPRSPDTPPRAPQTGPRSPDTPPRAPDNAASRGHRKIPSWLYIEDPWPPKRPGDTNPNAQGRGRTENR